MKPQASFIDLINDIDNLPQSFDFNSLYKLLLPHDDRPHGFITPYVVHHTTWPPTTCIAGPYSPTPATCAPTTPLLIDHATRCIHVCPAFAHSPPDSTLAAAISAALRPIAESILRHDGLGVARGEMCEQARIPGAAYAGAFPMLQASVAAHLGTARRGAHVMAYVRDPAADTDKPWHALRVWIGLNSADAVADPGMLVTTVSAEVPGDVSSMACALGQAEDQANFHGFDARIRPVGCVSYAGARMDAATAELRAVHLGMLHVFDLEVDPEEMPEDYDGYIELFDLLSIESVMLAMRRREFQPHSSLALLDFFIRHGILTEDNEPAYTEICARLHRLLPVPTSARVCAPTPE